MQDDFWSQLDSELAAALRRIPPEVIAPIRPEGIEAQRALVAGMMPGDPLDRIGPGLAVSEVSIPVDDGELEMLVLIPDTENARSRPAILHIHGGGLVAGDRFTGLDRVLDLAMKLGAVVASVEYRLAPEHPYPAPMNDCVVALDWLFDDSAALGVDANRVLLFAPSAGGGVALGTVLWRRDHEQRLPCGMVLVAPMVDDQESFPSSTAFGDGAPWTSISNRTGWAAYLGDLYGSDDVPVYAAPTRCTDFAGLPPTLIDVGSSDIFIDEGLDLATRMRRDGVPVELHVYPGGFHGFDVMAADTTLARNARANRSAFIERILAAGWPVAPTDTVR
ncbi:alpha/beta hydrolase [Nocardia sp. CA-120079]|uniref:alpha/beta hydrolase n=1 Tax=Nocardia sp. CA-120079 TaxID=3239974 RepID=UPI003D965834